MSDRKCTACGSEELKPITIMYSSIVEGKAYQTVDSFYCTKCGHVELYARTEEIQKCVEKERLQQAAEEESRARIAKIELLKTRITDLGRIISDENQTVKTVREAEVELKDAQRQLQQLNDECHRSKFKH